MSLTSLFNFNYLKENIKKSKAIILLCMLLLPTIGGIILLVKCSRGSNFMPSIYEVSGPMLFGMYLVPVVLSITLFSFIYKRGSIDFTLSMPINKKQIFLTNTFGGIIIILLMQIINLIITLAISLIYSNMIIDYKMLFDIFLIYSISYIFVFTSCNIAASVSSNKITTIVVTLLILFLVPFVSTFIKTDGFNYNNYGTARIECLNKECTPVIYECDSLKCKNDKRNNIYTGYVNRVSDNNYTMPYKLIAGVFLGEEFDSGINVSLLKMVFLSIVYIAVGLILFIKKKFEIVGTSFRSERVHILVRTLTTVPVVCILYVIIKNLGLSSHDFFTIILLLVLIFTYLIIYDLITRKRVTNFFKMAICLVIVSSAVCIVGAFFDDKEEFEIKVNDIKEITFVDDNNINIASTKNKDVINYAVSLLLDDNPRGNVYNMHRIKTKVKGDTYKFTIYVTEDDYNYINNNLVNDKEYLKTLEDYKDSRVFGIEYDNGYTGVKENKELANMIINEYKNNKDALKNVNNYDGLLNITLYIYDNYAVRNVVVNVTDNKDLVLNILKYYNTKTKEYLNKMNDNDIYSYDINGNFYGVSDGYYSELYSEIGKFIVDNIDENIDINKDYKYITINNDYDKNIFVTNRVEELDKIMEKYVNDNDDDISDAETARVM